MKKRNQFLLGTIRLCILTFALALLGIGCGNTVRNSKPLLVEVDRAFVSPEIIAPTNQDVKETVKSEPFGVAIIKAATYTRMDAKVSMFRNETVMNMCYFEGKRLGQLELAIDKYVPKVRNNTFGKPPRCDELDPNTS